MEISLLSSLPWNFCAAHTIHTMKERYLAAVAHGGDRTDRLFTRLYDLFIRESDTDTGLGSHYLVDLVVPAKGDCGQQVISIFCDNHDIPVVVFRLNKTETIRDVVKSILTTSPPRCAMILDIRDNELLRKVRTRIARTHCDLRYRRVIFCITDYEMPSGSSSISIHIPGSVEDKITMLLCHLPDHIRLQDVSPDRFRPLAECMVDYTLFQPRVWRNVNVEGTLEEFLSTAMFQIVRHVCNDPGVGDAYPSFEKDWRNSMATRLKHTLSIPPEALCPSIHRVIPIGVLPEDAMQAMKVAIPKDIQNPYAITVQTNAVDDRCGSIAITQPMNYTVVYVNCMINTGLIVDVCRELRTGHRAVVSEVHSMRVEYEQTRIHNEQTSTELKI
jgi:hypothetical protein